MNPFSRVIIIVLVCGLCRAVIPLFLFDLFWSFPPGVDPVLTRVLEQGAPRHPIPLRHLAIADREAAACTVLSPTPLPDLPQRVCRPSLHPRTT